LSTNLRLLLDESVTDPLAEQIRGSSHSLNIEYCRDLSICGAPDPAVIQYARDHARIVVTTETGMNHKSFPVCTHPGIIVLAGKHRHESVHAGIFRKFLLSGHRKESKDAVTYLSENEMRVKKHRGDVSFRLD
jgi:predicted nuclease of predicted toxin-antitoxin system